MLENRFEHMSVIANDFTILQACRGETILAVLDIPSTKTDFTLAGTDWLIIFMSGYSLQVHPNRSFWVNSRKKTRELVRKEVDRRTAKIEQLAEAKIVLENLPV